LITLFSPRESRVVARCQGHTAFVTGIAFDHTRSGGYRFGSVGEDGKLVLVSYDDPSFPLLLSIANGGVNCIVGFYRRFIAPTKTPCSSYKLFQPSTCSWIDTLLSWSIKIKPATWCEPYRRTIPFSTTSIGSSTSSTSHGESPVSPYVWRALNRGDVIGKSC
jgi:hypothetical protein